MPKQCAAMRKDAQRCASNAQPCDAQPCAAMRTHAQVMRSHAQ
jgi:hypothetical protein